MDISNISVADLNSESVPVLFEHGYDISHTPKNRKKTYSFVTFREVDEVHFEQIFELP